MGMYKRARETYFMRAYTKGYVQGWVERATAENYHPAGQRHRDWCDDGTCPCKK